MNEIKRSGLLLTAFAFAGLVGENAASAQPTVAVTNCPPLFGGPPEMAVPSSLRVFRVQPPGLPLLPHESPFFSPYRYGLSEARYSHFHALYVTSDQQTLTSLRATQGYFSQGQVLCEDTLGNLVRQANGCYNRVQVINDGIFSGTNHARDGFIIIGEPIVDFSLGAGRASLIGSWGVGPHTLDGGARTWRFDLPKPAVNLASVRTAYINPSVGNAGLLRFARSPGVAAYSHFFTAMSALEYANRCANRFHYGRDDDPAATQYARDVAYGEAWKNVWYPKYHDTVVVPTHKQFYARIHGPYLQRKALENLQAAIPAPSAADWYVGNAPITGADGVDWNAVRRSRLGLADLIKTGSTTNLDLYLEHAKSLDQAYAKRTTLSAGDKVWVNQTIQMAQRHIRWR